MKIVKQEDTKSGVTVEYHHIVAIKELDFDRKKAKLLLRSYVDKNAYDSQKEANECADQANDVAAVVDFLVLAENCSDNPVVLRFDTFTKYKTARKLSAFIKKYQSLHGMKYKITAVQTKNKAGQYYYEYNVEPLEWLNKAEYALVNQAKEEHTAGFDQSSSLLGYDDNDDDGGSEM